MTTHDPRPTISFGASFRFVFLFRRPEGRRKKGDVDQYGLGDDKVWIMIRLWGSNEGYRGRFRRPEMTREIERLPAPFPPPPREGRAASLAPLLYILYTIYYDDDDDDDDDDRRWLVFAMVFVQGHGGTLQRHRQERYPYRVPKNRGRRRRQLCLWTELQIRRRVHTAHGTERRIISSDIYRNTSRVGILP